MIYIIYLKNLHIKNYSFFIPDKKEYLQDVFIFDIQELKQISNSMRISIEALKGIN
ncbi:hypothetical protein GCM10022422_37080 [Flavobacterium ginsengisoli]|uniref:Uncharacterized protein n=1 Tax=Flavobacterium ginsengisoli TaxID=871694 RepID=A0ABP7G141_9FLAO